MSTTTATVPMPGLLLRLALGACLALFAAAWLAASPAQAVYGDQYDIAPAEGDALPGPKAFWAGTCDLASAPAPGGEIPGGVGERTDQVVVGYAGFFNPVPSFGPAPETPLDCIDPGVGNGDFTGASPWITPPSWRLAALTQAGAHPDATATFAVTRDSDQQSGAPGVMPAGSTRDVKVRLPSGLAGNPRAVPKCSNEQFEQSTVTCPPETQVGVAELRLNFTIAMLDIVRPVYNLEPRKGRTAEFGIPNVTFTSIRITADARTDGDFGLDTGVERIPTGVPLLQQSLTFWGTPWDPTHDIFRPAQDASTDIPGDISQSGLADADQASYHPSWGPIKPFLSNPTTCDGTEPTTTAFLDSWQNVGDTLPNGSPDPDDPRWKRAHSASPPVTGCDKLAEHFDPSFTLQPTTDEANSPTALEVELAVPQNNDAPIEVPADNASQSVIDDYVSDALDYWRSDAGLASAHLKDTTVELPEGVTVNPSSANGLEACSEEQMGLTSRSPLRFDRNQVDCPDASKLGTVQIDTPLLEQPLKGSIYLAEQDENPFDSLLAIYLVASDPDRGLTIKLAGETAPDEDTGQITATFLNNPQLPFDTLKLRFKGGATAPLKTPPLCGTYTTESSLTPWSAPQSGGAVSTADSFEITSGPEGTDCVTDPADRPFDPELTNTGLIDSAAASSSPFVLRLTRGDAEQEFDRLTVDTPEGLSAVLKSAEQCSDAAVEADDCPAASKVGEAIVGAGAGPSPYYVKGGQVFLAGPYDPDGNGPKAESPLSLSIQVPAVAGPFELGMVNVRSAIYVNPRTAKLTVASDPLPQMLRGIPLTVREIRIKMNKPGFMIAPTSCDQASVDVASYGIDGAEADASAPFQIEGCDQLRFSPKLNLAYKGKRSKKRNGHPRLAANLTVPQAEENFDADAGNDRAGARQANLDKVRVVLPRGTYLDQDALSRVCTPTQWDAEDCPEDSKIGNARAWSPLLAEPLKGPVYLKVGPNELPDLAADLNGIVDIDLFGKIDQSKGRIRNTFQVVPDVPVSQFKLNLRGGNGGLLVNSRDVCKGKKALRRANVNMNAHNGARLKSKQSVVRCGGKKKRRRAQQRERAQQRKLRQERRQGRR